MKSDGWMYLLLAAIMFINSIISILVDENIAASIYVLAAVHALHLLKRT